jgi:hypothetical protein
MKYLKINPYLSVLFLFIYIGPAYAEYQIVYPYIQYRVFEDGRKFNKLYFEIKDENSSYHYFAFHLNYSPRSSNRIQGMTFTLRSKT